MYVAALDNMVYMDPCVIERGDIHSTCIMKAIENGHLDICKCLVTKGADIHNDQDDQGKSCIMVAAERGHLDICMWLLDNGVEMKSYTFDIFVEDSINSIAASSSTVDDVKRYNTSALHLAARNNHYKVVKLFLEKDADPFYCMVLWVIGRQYRNNKPFVPRIVLAFGKQKYRQSTEIVLNEAKKKKSKEEVLDAVKNVGWLRYYAFDEIKVDNQVILQSSNDCGPFPVHCQSVLLLLQRLYSRIAEHEKKLMLDHFLPFEYSPQNLNGVDDYNAVMTQVMAAWYMRNDIGVCVDAVLLDDADLEAIPCE